MQEKISVCRKSQRGWPGLSFASAFTSATPSSTMMTFSATDALHRVRQYWLGWSAPELAGSDRFQQRGERLRQPAGWMIAIRLGEKNQAIMDYLFLPSSAFTGIQLWFSEEGRLVRKIERFETFEQLARSVIKRLKERANSRSIRRRSRS
jgi:hypothetical protein